MTIGRWQADLELAPHAVAPGTVPGPASAPRSIEPDGEPALGQSPAEAPPDASGRKPGTMATVYPIGLPLHVIPLAALFGWSFGPFLIGPLSAVLSIFLVYKVAREYRAGQSSR